MAILLLESFEGIEDPEDKYTIESAALVNISSAYYRSGAQSLLCSYGYWFRIDLPASTDDGVIGFGYRFSDVSTTATTGALVMFYDGSGEQISLDVDPMGRLHLARGATILAYSSKNLIRQKWQYIEVKWNCVNSIGADTFIVRLDGVEVINLAATTDCQAQAGSGVTIIYIQGASHASNNYFDDLYVLDLTGAAPNNDFLGDIQITALNPNGNGNASDFTGSDADSTDNYLHVDETIPDWDTSYVESLTIGHVDLYTYEDLPATPDTIYAVQTVMVARKDTAGARYGNLLTRVNSTNYNGDTFAPVEGSYTYHTKIWELNPDDSAAWAGADVNGAEFGVGVVATP